MELKESIVVTEGWQVTISVCKFGNDEYMFRWQL